MSHKSTIMAIAISTIAACLAASCSKQETPHQQQVIRLDKTLASYDNFDNSKQLEVLDSLRPEIDAMFAVLGYHDVTQADLIAWSESDVVRVFQPDVDSIFPTTATLEAEIGHIVYYAVKDSLDLPALKFATVTWGNPRPIVRVDSIVLIALNHFLGADYPGYQQWPEFRRVDKTPEALPYGVAAVLAATQYPMVTSDNTTLLSWMLYEGVLVEARMRLVKDAKLHLALGYSVDQLKYIESHTQDIWQDMAVRKLIYETDPTIIDRYIAPSPSSPLLNSNVPGRIGRYIGYRIVKSYLDKHSMTLGQMLKPEFYNSQQTLIESGFNGR